MNSFIIENGKYGKKIVVTSHWNNKISNYIKKNNIKEIELNYAKGWKDSDVLFLKEITSKLLSLTITNYNLDNISIIHNLKSLKELNIDSYDKTELDFSNFKELEDCFLEWRPKAKSIFKNKSLKKLYIQNFKSKDTNDFSEMTQLKELKLGNSPIEDLTGLKSLKKLRFLGLYSFRKLSNLFGLEYLINLEELEINYSKKFVTIDEIGALKKLQKLQLCSNRNINTLKPLEKTNKLESFFFYEDTNIIDGNLNVLWNMDNLKNIAFQNRKHYSHSREDFFNKLGIKG